jgi:hypothetical protein
MLAAVEMVVTFNVAYCVDCAGHGFVTDFT